MIHRATLAAAWIYAVSQITATWLAPAAIDLARNLYGPL